MKGPSAETLSTNDARVQNLNYKDVLLFADEWLTAHWTPTLFETMFDIPADSIHATRHAVQSRLQDIEYLLLRYPESG